MQRKYETWIETYRLEKGYVMDGEKTVRHMCQSASHAMAIAFPELRVCKGFIRTPVNGGGQHWWCSTTDGEIVDPTLSQFPNGVSSYEEYDITKHGELPRGKCMNCGELTYSYSPDANICSDECGEDFEQAMAKDRAEWMR